MLFEKVSIDNPKLLYLQIADKIEKGIKSNEIQVGQRIPPIRELHKKFGVGLDTVKDALAKLEREGYISCIRKRGTFVISSEPKNGIDLKRKNIIGFVLCPVPDPSDPHIAFSYHQITDGAEEKARKNKLNMIYKNMEDGTVNFGNLENDIAGLIVTGRITSERIMNIQKTKLPFVLIGDPYEKEKVAETFDVVGNDDFQRAYLGARHLLDLGHRKILYISRSVDGYSWEIEMFNGYKEALKENGIEYDDKLILQLESYDETGAYKAMSEFLNGSISFTGAVCMGEVIHGGVMKVFGGKSIKVPDDVSIVVCGNGSSDATKVIYDMKDLGREAVELLCKKVSSPDWKPKRSLIPNRFIAGNTTRKIVSND